jgi:hypothetical protein
MSTVKISELTNLPDISSNTSNTLFLGVDIPTGTTGKLTATTLAQHLYANNFLVVGDYYTVEYPNTIGMFVYPSDSYIQTIIENESDSGTSDFVAMANTSSDTEYYIDMGFAGADYDNSSPLNSLGTSLHPLDGYMYVQGLDGNPGGNLVIGTTITGTKINFIVGGVDAANVVGYMDGSGIHSSTITSASNYANGAFIQANAAFIVANNTVGVDATQNTSITAAFLKANTPSHVANSSSLYANGAFAQANAAFDKANNALANTTGSFNGSLTILNDLNVNGTISFSNSTFSSSKSLVTLSASNTGYSQPPGGDGYVLHMTGKHNTPVRVVSDSYGANGQLVFPLFGGRAARGNVTNPAAVQTNDVLTRIGASGYGTTGWQTGGTARIDFVASENHSDTNRGTVIKFYNIMAGSNTIQNIANFNANDAVFVGVVNPQKGFAYTPNNITTNSTAYTIDFDRDSMVRMSVNDNSTITLSNYKSGKIVEVWMTNSAAQNKSITHGCLANNSTSKLTTFTIQSNSCAFLKYFSIDGDLANTFVSITA